MRIQALDPVTLKQVAEAAGVSLSTASRALAGKAREFRISEQTEAAVRRAAGKLGFQPNQVARSLRSRRSGLVGVLVPDISNPFFASITRELTIRAEAEGLAVLIADSQESTEREITLLENLKARQVEALVVCPVGEAAEHLRPLESSNLPVVMVDRVFSGLSLPAVTSDHAAGAEAATRVLIEQGHRVIGCLQGRPNTWPNQQRMKGHRRALREAGIAISRADHALVRGTAFSEESGYRATRELLLARADVTALFAFNNQIVLGALRALAELGRAVPAELSLVAFDDPPYADFLAVPLSTVRQDVAEIGCLAAEVLMEQLRSGRRPKKRQHCVPVEMVMRQSVGHRKESGVADE